MTETPNERTEVELTLIEQLKALEWQHLRGDIEVPYLTERSTFREVLLVGRLREALRRVNPHDDGKPWLDETRLGQAVGALERLGAYKLMEATQAAHELLLTGTPVDGDPELDAGRDRIVRFIDFENPGNNDFLVINQFRVDPPGGRAFIVPDVVLFVNGIPLVVIECKSPAATDPMQEGITQLLRYSNQRDWFEEDEGAERLFHYNLLLVSTFFYQARAAGIGSSYEDFLEWKDTSPVPMAEVAAGLGVERLSSQHILVAGMLRPIHLLDLLRNFTGYKQDVGRTIKVVARYQQFRAVHAAIRRLSTGKTRHQDGQADRRGGIIWHTQGSGKSLTMVFLVRKMRTLQKLRRFKVVAVTDRTDLEKQLRATAHLTGETVRRADSTEDLKRILKEEGPDLVFATIQKYLEREGEDETDGAVLTAGAGGASLAADRASPQSAELRRLLAAAELFPVLNESEEILVLVDEAHRSQSSQLHANLMRALPNCARIGFTGTPILMGDRKRTAEIFGDFIDSYTIQQSEADHSTLRILYEGRTAEGAIADGRSMDDLFEDMFPGKTPAEKEAIQARYATRGNVLEAPRLIQAKATDLLRHYIDVVMPNGLKAQIVATSRLAAIRYHEALRDAHADILSRVEGLDPAVRALSEEEAAGLPEDTRFLRRAQRSLDTLRRLEFAVVISGSHNDDPAWRTWTEKTQQDAAIARFKRPLDDPDPLKRDGLAFLCVKSMLLTGFDAPVLQVLYLDRFMKDHELLQAIARVNRTRVGKTCGLLVDYFGVARHLKEALAVYAREDIQGVLTELRDELPRLADRHARAVAVFRERGVEITHIEGCVDLLRDLRVRADFSVKLGAFLETLDIVLPRPEGLPYVRDAKILGFIQKAAANRYRDPQLNIIGAAQKVRQLIEEHIVSQGIDPKVPPISITDAEFDKAVDAYSSPRAKASEMEHALRYHIRERFREDPARYRKLSERLEQILKDFKDNWDALLVALRELTREARADRGVDRTGLDPKTQAPFLGLLVEAVGSPVTGDGERLKTLADHTIEMVDHIRQEIAYVDFWRNTNAQAVLRGWIVRYLDENDIVSFDRQEAVADEIVDLARALHSRLVA
jgi:type I restriction enzyme R subunit